MRYLIFLLLLIAVLISAGCVNDSQKSTESIAAYTTAPTIQQTVQTISSPTVTEKIVEPIVGIWKGSFNNDGTAGYCEFSDNGVLKLSTSYGKGSSNMDLVALQMRFTAEVKYFGIKIPSQNLMWVKTEDHISKPSYITTMQDGTKLISFYYNSEDDSVIVKETGLKLNRISGHSFD